MDERPDLVCVFGADHIYLEVDDGVAAFQAQIPVASQEG